MDLVRDFSADYNELISGCAIFDRSDRGKLSLTGMDARSFLNGQVTNDIEILKPGTGCYAAFLTPKGKMLGDLRVLNLGDELWLDTERVALQNLFDLLRRTNVGFDAELHKRTLQQSLVSLIGPRAIEIFNDVSLPHEFGSASFEVDSVTTTIAKTDIGVDVIFPADKHDQIWNWLLAKGAREVSEAADECLRIESGIPRYGAELDQTTIPQEADLNRRAVSFTKGCYVGQETVARLYYKGKPNRYLAGLRLERPTTPGQELILDGKTVGKIGSATVSPNYGPIALAMIRREVELGSQLDIDGGNAVVAALPFTDDESPSVA